jgi:hypothetical protein
MLFERREMWEDLRDDLETFVIEATRRTISDSLACGMQSGM